MQIKYDWPDMPVGTPLSFGGLLVLNGKVMTISVKDQEIFRQSTGRTLAEAAKSTTQLTIPRKR